MKANVTVSKEEMDALFHHEEVSKTYFETIRPTMLKRFVLICLLLIARVFVVSYYPEYLPALTINGLALDVEAINSMIQARGAIALTVGALYIYSLHKNMYFRSMNVFFLVVFCCLIWNDVANHLSASWDTLNYVAVGLMVSRVIILVLILQNYLDVRRE
jgi:uncharacterized membrane protein YecN with MAPEG domain